MAVMGIEAFGRAVKHTVDNALVERDRRYNSPTFQAELAREKLKFNQSLKDMGARAGETAYAAIIKAPLTPVWRSLQTIAGAKKPGNNNSKYSFGDIVLDSIGGVADAGWKATKLLAAVTVATGRAGKLALRHTLAL